ncbi:hypothetical protein V8D89_015835 [Ganoderma adspersum]
MTTFLPIDTNTSLPSTPAFLVPSPDPVPVDHVKQVIRTILKGHRIVIVCGAGISVQVAGIPDFRSSHGLFQSLKKDHPMLTSGKVIFDASVFSAVEPTVFHRLLRVLYDCRRLLRVYTQNIDALEDKSGLTFGIPGLGSNHGQHRYGGAKAPDVPSVQATPADMAHSAAHSRSQLLSRLTKTPTCIPLHGTLRLMHCVACAHSYPLRDHIDSLVSGTPPPWKRCHGIGKLCPSIVLYNEDHRNGEEVGEAIRRDLMGSSKGKSCASADLLLVHIVWEFSRAVKYRPAPPVDEPNTSAHGLVTPMPSPCRSTVTADKASPVQTIYLNLDFPLPAREWEGVWIWGDGQAFARMEEQMKNATKGRKRKRTEAVAEDAS